MNEQYKHLSRSAFHMGLCALRMRLAVLRDQQLGLKKRLRAPHVGYMGQDQGSLEHGKMLVTATLNVYLHVRGKSLVDKTGRSIHRADKFPTAWYQRARGQAQEEFDQQAEIHQKAWEAAQLVGK